MDPRLQTRIQRYGWDRAAAAYEDAWADQLRPGQDRMLELAGLAPGERVLEAACGTGLVTLRAADAVGPGGHVLGTDISQTMVDIAAAAAAARPNVGFARMGFEDLATPDECFDAALCAFGLMYAADSLEALRRVRAVLRPGGRAAVAVWGARARCGWAPVFPIVDARVRSEVCPLFFRLGTGEILRQEMAVAGFRAIRAERMAVSLRYASAEAAVAAAFVGGPVALAYSRFEPAVRRAVAAEYLEAIEPWRSGGGYALPGEFVVAVGEA